MAIHIERFILAVAIITSSSMLAGCGENFDDLNADSKSEIASSKSSQKESVSKPVVDIMIVYTRSVREAVGGDEAMANLITLAEETTNQGYEASNVNVRIRIVKAVEVTYDDSTGHDQALEEIKDRYDGKLDDIHRLREDAGADVVSFWINNRRMYCGLAYQMKNVNKRFERYAFNVVDYLCALGTYAFAHEVGHNMGAGHDRAHADAVSAYSYSYGYTQKGGNDRFRTIMAYPCGGCMMLNQWSNPDVLYNGVPTGERDVTDNALTLSRTSGLVAQWRTR